MTRRTKGRVEVDRAGTRAPPGQVRHLRERRRQLVVPLARDHGGDAEQLAPGGGARRQVGAVHPGLGHVQARRVQRVAVEQPAPGPVAGRQHRRRMGEHRGLVRAGARPGSPRREAHRAACGRSTTTRSRVASGTTAPGVHEATRPSRSASRTVRQRREDLGEHGERPGVRSGPPSGDGGAGGRTSRARRGRRRSAGRRCCRRSAAPGRRPRPGRRRAPSSQVSFVAGPRDVGLPEGDRDPGQMTSALPELSRANPCGEGVGDDLGERLGRRVDARRAGCVVEVAVGQLAEDGMQVLGRPRRCRRRRCPSPATRSGRSRPRRTWRRGAAGPARRPRRAGCGRPSCGRVRSR